METATIERKRIATRGVQHAEANINGERPTGYWWCSSVQLGVNANEAKVFKSARSAFGAL